MKLKAPFPWFGGKSRIAHLAWDAFGNVPNYVEPFGGSMAVLLARPHRPRAETVNDEDCYVANFWRALKHDPDTVAWWADWPVNEADLNAKKLWMKQAHSNGLQEIKVDVDYYDAKLAGVWVWAVSQSIGDISRTCMPNLGDRGKGVHRSYLPNLGNRGKGVHRSSLPNLGDRGKGVHRYLVSLAERLRRVRVTCGNWARILTPSVTTKHGPTAVFLDPPYEGFESAYASQTVDHSELQAWCLEHGEDKLFRIALCGYDGNLEKSGWNCVTWTARRGYSSSKNKNRFRERIWFSPHCIQGQKGLF